MKYLTLALFALFLAGCHNPRTAVVRLTGHKGQCSGVQVITPSGAKAILTAAHCNVLAEGGTINVSFDEGRPTPRRVIEVSETEDLMLLEPLPGPAIKIADADFPHEQVRSFTHGAGMGTYETDGELIENTRVSFAEPFVDDASCSGPKRKVQDIPVGFWIMKACVTTFDATVSTVRVVPGSSGGPVVNSFGELVGIVSASDEYGFSYLGRLSDIHDFLKPY